LSVTVLIFLVKTLDEQYYEEFKIDTAISAVVACASGMC
jgi:hypothetical protein